MSPKKSRTSSSVDSEELVTFLACANSDVDATIHTKKRTTNLITLHHVSDRQRHNNETNSKLTGCSQAVSLCVELRRFAAVRFADALRRGVCGLLV